MILKNRLFSRKSPERDAKSYFIFCEGNKREHDYFMYFKEIDSKINVIICNPDPHDDNSPEGLYRKAKNYLIKSFDNPKPKYELLDIDEVWFVIDTDKWEAKIDVLKESISGFVAWNIAQSNPCFEVWFYFHFNKSTPNFEGMEASKNWKKYVNFEVIKGGFDSRKHPILIKTAIENSKANYIEYQGSPQLGTTQMHKLAERFYPLIKETIEEGIRVLGE